MNDQPNNPTISDMNRDIALFMGAVMNPMYTDHPTYLYEIRPTTDSCYNWTARQMQYHERCDWLMPVWIRFRDLNFNGYPIEVIAKHNTDKRLIAQFITDNPITEAHRLIWEGVKWLETIKK